MVAEGPAAEGPAADSRPYTLANILLVILVISIKNPHWSV